MSAQYEYQKRYLKSLFVPLYRTVPELAKRYTVKCTVPYRGIFRYPDVRYKPRYIFNQDNPGLCPAMSRYVPILRALNLPAKSAGSINER